jgi:UDP-2-acetamido-2-deoxy-ribo-hexuluronate aminotransferase
MDILLDINVAVDNCTGRKPWHELADLAIAKCQSEGGRVWLYTGSVQTLQYVTRSELQRIAVEQGRKLSGKQLEMQARSLLREFVADKHWLSALASEGPVFEAHDPEDEQLILALSRFPAGSIKLLTRDETLLTRHPDQTITPEAYCLQSPKQAKIDFIDLKTQQDAIRPQLERRLHSVLHHGQYILGPEVRELEQQLAAYTGAQHCITVASGTEALLISLMALGIGPGDEVITTPFTFVATAEVIVLLGAKPVFVDVEPDTGNIDAALFEAKITKRTKAIMPVSLYGQPADMDAINATAARHGHIPVIEDAAQSFGSEYKSKKSCNLSTLGCTSFFPSKPLGCYGDGGAIFTGDDQLAQACREIRVHGQSQRYVHTRIGVGGRMDTLQCAVLLAKLPRFDHEVAQRIEIGQRYNALIDQASIPRIQQRPDRTSVFAQYTVLVDDRAALQPKLQAAGVPTAVHYPVPLNQQPAYAHLCCPDCTPVAARLAQRVMSLPMSPDLTEHQLTRVINAIRA